MVKKSLSLVLLIFIVFACNTEEARYERLKKERLKKKRELEFISRVDALPLKVKSPETNKTTAPKVELGRLLFYDPILSGDKDIACVTCHHPDNGYAEFRDISIGTGGKGFANRRVANLVNGIPPMKKNAHTILNTAFNGIQLYKDYNPDDAPMFWDKRTSSLELQAIEPIKAIEEMKGLKYSEEEILVEIVNRLKSIPEYLETFTKVFNEPDPVTIENVGKAIAAFERTLLTNNSRFDQYMRGDKSAMSLSEKDGFEVFKKVGCPACHNGPMFSDYKIHVLGVPDNKKLSEVDKGLDDTFGFRTASLRNLRFTAPYMHNGTLQSLKRVLEFYEDISFGKIRNSAVAKEDLDPFVKDLNLKVKDMAPIISFLNTLNDPDFDKKIPTSVPSGLPVGGNIE